MQAYSTLGPPRVGRGVRESRARIDMGAVHGFAPQGPPRYVPAGMRHAGSNFIAMPLMQ
jgi:hypothetical protein